jgi:hypothetical protein
MKIDWQREVLELIRLASNKAAGDEQTAASLASLSDRRFYQGRAAGHRIMAGRLAELIERDDRARIRRSDG